MKDLRPAREFRFYKTCVKCKSYKSIEKFAVDKTNTIDGYGDLCLYCKHKVIKIHQITQKDKLNQLKLQPCTDCHQTYNPWQMDYDHLPEYKKKKNISMMTRAPNVDLEAELAKCELVCANCHRNRTHSRQLQKKDPLNTIAIDSTNRL